MAPVSLRVRAGALTVWAITPSTCLGFLFTPFSHFLLTDLASLVSWDAQSRLLPQGLCTCCSCCPEGSSLMVPHCLFHLLHIFAQVFTKTCLNILTLKNCNPSKLPMLNSTLWFIFPKEKNIYHCGIYYLFISPHMECSRKHIELKVMHIFRELFEEISCKLLEKVGFYFDSIAWNDPECREDRVFNKWILHEWLFLKFFKDFFYMKESERDTHIQREKETWGNSNCWLSPQMSTTTRAGPNQNQELCFLCGWQGSTCLSRLLPLS